jgi:hypothetical protein
MLVEYIVDRNRDLLIQVCSECTDYSFPFYSQTAISTQGGGLEGGAGLDPNCCRQYIHNC